MEGLFEFQQLRDGNFEGLGDFFEILNADIFFAPFNLADIRSMQVGFKSELFLSPAFFLADGSDPFADFFIDIAQSSTSDATYCRSALLISRLPKGSI
jgi:hypothetical protein